LRNTWTGHVPQVDIQLQQPGRLLQRLVVYPNSADNSVDPKTR
jgi:hypothetical protein